MINHQLLEHYMNCLYCSDRLLQSTWNIPFKFSHNFVNISCKISARGKKKRINQKMKKKIQSQQGLLKPLYIFISLAMRTGNLGFNLPLPQTLLCLLRWPSGSSPSGSCWVIATAQITGSGVRCTHT